MDEMRPRYGNGPKKIGGKFSIQDNKDVEELKRLVCQLNNVTWAQVQSSSRKTAVVRARHLYVHFMRTFSPRPSLKYIGDSIGGRDHTTVGSAINAIDEALESKDPYFDLHKKFHQTIKSTIKL